MLETTSPQSNHITHLKISKTSLTNIKHHVDNYGDHMRECHENGDISDEYYLEVYNYNNNIQKEITSRIARIELELFEMGETKYP